MPVGPERHATSGREAGAIGAGFAWPLAVKAAAPELIHKSDVGAVMLDVLPTLAARAYEQVVATAARAGHPAEGALLAPMASAGVEFLVGARWDEQFGPFLVVGAGGVTSEVARDVQVEPHPWTSHSPSRCSRVCASRRCSRAFAAGLPGTSSAAARVIAAISQLATDAGDALVEFDVNPLRVHPEGEGCTVLDAVAIVSVA